MSRITVVRLPLPDRMSPIERVMSTIGRVDLSLTDALHVGQSPRPYSVVVRPGALDVVAFDDAIAMALLRGEPLARIVTRIDRADLSRDGPGDRVLRVAVETPTHFRVRGLYHILPDIWHLFGGLQTRWDALGWPPLDPPDLRCVAVQLDCYRQGKLGEHRGFMGVLWLDLLPLPEADRATLWTLARFGEYRGTGAHTSYGMGRLRVLARGERWEPGARLACWDPVSERRGS